MPIKVTSALFTACIVSKDALPDDGLPIIALVGRSNVGKSSLINTISCRKELARTSSLPGKTLTINFYNFNDSFYIVDLPGYGYAKASKVTRQRIQVMMNEFFGACRNLKGVIQILDVRHKPSVLDKQMHEWLKEQKVNYLSVITKADKLSNQQALKMRKVILKEMGLDFAMLFSTKTQSGKEDFLDAVEKILSGYQFKASEPRTPRKNTNQGERGRPRPRREGGRDRVGTTDDKNPNSKQKSETRPERPKRSDSGNPTEKKEGSNSGKRRRRRPKKPSVGNREPQNDKPSA